MIPELFAQLGNPTNMLEFNYKHVDNENRFLVMIMYLQFFQL